MGFRDSGPRGGEGRRAGLDAGAAWLTAAALALSLASLAFLVPRMAFDRADRSYLAVVDYVELSRDVLAVGMTWEQAAERLAASGVNAVAMSRLGLEELQAASVLEVLPGPEGTEFAVVLPQTNKAGAIALAERLRSAVEKREFASDKGVLHVTISLGVATFPADARDKARLIKLADQALYEAKQAGRNRVARAG